MSYPAYPDYKDSGVEWLGKVPAHWEVKPLKRAIASVESGTSVNAADVPAVRGEKGVLKTSCVYRGWFDWRKNKTVNKEDLGRVSCPLRKNTLIVSRMNTPELVGAAGLVAEAPAGIFLPDRLWQVSMKGRCSPKYYYYFTRSPAYRDQVKIVCAGTSSSMQNLGQDDFGAIWHPSPPLHEQQIIAAFLDHETARIDALVEEQQRLIELLKEKRQAVISHAVTKGLDPDVPMKDSGVEWLGEVPENWEIKRVKHLCALGSDSLRPGPFGSHIKGDDFIEESSFRVYNQATVISDDFSKAAYIDESKYRELKAFYVRPKDILLTSRGTIGKISIVPESIDKGVIHPCLIRLRLDENQVYLPYFKFFFGDTDIAVEQLRLASNSTTIDVVYAENLANLWIAIPPVEEQERIAVKIGSQLRVISSIICAATQQVTLLKERRSALISAAVTGKIDVRGWQAAREADSSEMLMAAEERASYG